MSTSALAAPAKTRGMVVKAAFSAWLGSALEYYDFFIYGTAAALIFPKIMYDPTNAFQANIMSTASFGVAYLVRPLGSFVMGHLGDRYGRKLVLYITLFGMGLATLLIGVLPTYAMIGWWAPVLVVLLRMAQGFAVAGEQSSATTMVLEHSTDRTRGFWSSFTLGGTQLGFILGTAVFLPLSLLPDTVLYGWAWRLPFLASVLVVILAWWIRRSVEETPEFTAEKEAEEAHDTAVHESMSRQTPQVGNARRAEPVARALAVEDVPPFKWLSWFYLPSVIRVLLACFISVVSTVMSIYALNYGTGLGINRVTILTMQIVANILALGVILLMGMLSDRIGRKPVYLFGALGCAVLIWPFILSVLAKDVPMIFFWGILTLGIVYSGYSGSGMGMFSEQFETKVRVSGMAISTQFGFALGGFAPTIIMLLQGSVVNESGKTVQNYANWQPAAIFTMIVCLVAAGAALCNRETARKPQSELGSPSALRARELAAANAGAPLPQTGDDHPSSNLALSSGVAGAVFAVVTVGTWFVLKGPWWIIPFALTGITSVTGWNSALRAQGEISLGAPYRSNPRLRTGYWLGRVVGYAVVLVLVALLIAGVALMLLGRLKL